MKKQIGILALALGPGFALPAVAQLHIAQANPPPALKANPAATTAPVLPDAAKVVSKADAEAFAAAEFAFADADKNAKITKIEFKALDDARKGKETASLNDAAPAGATAPSSDVPVKTADAQYTEIAGAAPVVDKKVFTDARLAAFAKADADANGLLSKTESEKFVDIVSGKSARSAPA